MSELSNQNRWRSRHGIKKVDRELRHPAGPDAVYQWVINRTVKDLRKARKEGCIVGDQVVKVLNRKRNQADAFLGSAQELQGTIDFFRNGDLETAIDWAHVKLDPDAVREALGV